MHMHTCAHNIHTCTNIGMHMCTHLPTHKHGGLHRHADTCKTCMHTCVPSHMHTHAVHTHVDTCACTCILKHRRVHMHPCTLTPPHTEAHECTDICTHIHINTHTCISFIAETPLLSSDREDRLIHIVADFVDFRGFWKVWKDIVGDK